MKNLYLKNKEIINYLIFGALTTVVSFISYYLFARILLIDEVISNALSWFFSVLFAYITNKLFVFESKTFEKKNLFKEIISFFLARILTGILCDVLIFALFVKIFKINDIISKLITQVIVIVLNYLFSKLYIFRKKEY